MNSYPTNAYRIMPVGLVRGNIGFQPVNSKLRYAELNGTIHGQTVSTPKPAESEDSALSLGLAVLARLSRPQLEFGLLVWNLRYGMRCVARRRAALRYIFTALRIAKGFFQSRVDAFTLQTLAGHSSIVTSQRYVHPTLERVEDAITRLEAYNARKRELAQETA